jgi:Carboxypeptidase regulatory-like domain
LAHRHVVLCVIAASAVLLHGQEFRATLTGRVLDSGGAPIPNAKVTVKNTATGELRAVTTDAQGNYLAPLLNPAIYSVRAEALGFQTSIKAGLELSVNQTATLDLKLQLGSIKTEVTVTAEVPMLDDANADRGSLIDAESVREYPLNSRNPFMLAMLTPGVNFDGELTYQRPFDNGAIANWSINGSQQREFLLDGAPNNSQAGNNNIAFVPPVDAVQEFKIQTNAYDAQYRGAGDINVALKSGGNRVHGALYEFARRSAWDANSFQNNARCVSFANGKCRGAPKDGHYLDQYGVQMDGPVYLPKLYNRPQQDVLPGQLRTVSRGLAAAAHPQRAGARDASGRFQQERRRPRPHDHHIRSNERTAGRLELGARSVPRQRDSPGPDQCDRDTAHQIFPNAQHGHARPRVLHLELLHLRWRRFSA